jgi:hypothetical protein
MEPQWSLHGLQVTVKPSAPIKETCLAFWWSYPKMCDASNHGDAERDR